MDTIKRKLADLPTNPGVYIMYSDQRQILYIGKARNLKNRVKQYFANSANKTEKTIRLVSHIADFDYIITRNEIEALVLENNLIKKHKPPYNILLKDDKSYPFIRIDTKQDFPRVEVVRKLRNDGAKYFGPYMQGISSKEIYDLIHSAFCLRTCNLDMKRVPSSHRPCLNYHIHRCSAPCDHKCTAQEYHKEVEQVIAFLRGNDKTVANLLQTRMQQAAENEEFELALTYKQKLDVLDKLVRKQVTALAKSCDMDIFAIADDGLNRAVAVLFVRAGKLVGSDKDTVSDMALSAPIALSNYMLRYYDTVGYIPEEIVTAVPIEDADVLQAYLSEKKQSQVNLYSPIQGVRRQLADMAMSNATDYLEKSVGLQERKENMTVGAVLQLQEYLRLERMPVRMECYDISHVQGTDKVASMAVFVNGQPARSQYRKFKIRTVEGNNDFASLAETLTRRLTRLADPQEKDESFATCPDLIVIDGGKGQLSSVMEVARTFDTVHTQWISLAKREEEVFVPDRSQPYVLPRNSFALRMLQRIRDEAHRFAITFHRQQRGHRQTHSTLLGIDNVGPVRVKQLYARFHTIEQMRNATIEELQSVKGMDRRAAENVYAALHPPQAQTPAQED